MRLRAVAILLALAPAACLVPDPGDAAFVPELHDYRTSGDFVHVNSAPMDSAISGDISVECWVSAMAAAEYDKVAPESTGSGARLPYGTIIVREVHDRTTGALTKLTVMGKGPTGVAPELGDWWFAVTDVNGVPLADDTGHVLAGDLTACHDCHKDRAGDDFLFGVARSAR